MFELRNIRDPNKDPNERDPHYSHSSRSLRQCPCFLGRPELGRSSCSTRFSQSKGLYAVVELSSKGVHHLQRLMGFCGGYLREPLSYLREPLIFMQTGIHALRILLLRVEVATPPTPPPLKFLNGVLKPKRKMTPKKLPYLEVHG